MINWNEVKVGETEIERDGIIAKIIGLYDKWVWVKCHEATWIRLKDELDDWTIYDPWEEITNNCQWVRCTHTDTLWVLYHENMVISHTNHKYRVDAPRVWKRKEGR